MWEASTDEKTSKNRAKQCKTVILAPKRPLQLSKFKFFNSKFEFQASSCITNPKYHTWSVCGVWAPRRLPQTRKRRKTVQNSAKQWFWRQNDRYSSQNSKFLIQNLNFKPLFALLISNITYMKRLPGMGNVGGFHRRENSEKQRKTAKNSETAIFGAKNSR